MQENPCLSWDEVCDNVIHCPLSRDDETHCDLATCSSECQCFGLTLKCASSSMSTVPQFDEWTVSIDLSRNMLTPIHLIFQSYPGLVKHDISRNKITDIRPQTFHSWGALHHVDLRRNKLRSITK